MHYVPIAIDQDKDEIEEGYEEDDDN